MTPDRLVIDDGTGTASVSCIGLEHMGSVGETLDCVGWWNATRKRVEADHIIWKVTAAAESLRWAELASPGRVSPWGLPMMSFRKDDLRNIIANAGTNGATLEDLELVLEIPATNLLAMCEELQTEGAIYMNRQGAYVPL